MASPLPTTFKPTALKLDKLQLDPDNARLHPHRNMEAVKASLQRFGQRQVVVVQKAGMVVRAGNARVVAARELGWSHIAGIVIDENDTEAMAYALADNRSSELAEWDLPNLSGALSALLDANIDPEVLGWTPDEIDLFLNADWSPPVIADDGTTPDGPTDLEPITTPAIALSPAQWAQLEQAMERIRAEPGNEGMTVAMCVAALATAYLAGQ